MYASIVCTAGVLHGSSQLCVVSRFTDCPRHAAPSGRVSYVAFVVLSASLQVPFDLSGDRSIFEHLHRVLVEKGSAVVVVAEGAGQDMLGPAGGADASGNKKYSDVGKWLAVTPSPSAPSQP